MVRLYTIEENNPWPNSGVNTKSKAQINKPSENIQSASEVSPIEKILTCLEHNPFGMFETMRLPSLSNKAPPPNQVYNHDRALSALSHQTEGRIELAAQHPFALRGSIARGEWRNVTMVATANKYLEELNQPKLFNYLHEMSALFEKFLYSVIQTHSDIAEFYDDNELDPVPPCFGDYLEWYHLISPLAYEPYLSREEMLSIPAYRVQEIGDAGWVELVMYEDPLSYASPQTRECIVELTNYINDRRHDWTATAARPQKAGIS